MLYLKMKFAVDDYICYEMEVRKKKAMMPLDDLFSEVLLPDYCSIKKRLKVNISSKHFSKN